MTSMELEAYKAELACEILTTDSRQVLDEVKRLLTKLSKKTKKKEETISKEEILAGIDAGLKDIKAKRTRPATELLQELRCIFVEDYNVLLQELKQNPQAGIDLGGGLRKIRMKINSKGKGKSGGARVISF